jgi:tetratricopeptide (TPR) repeat protein
MRSVTLALYLLCVVFGDLSAQEEQEYFKFAMFKYNNKEYEESLAFLDKALDKDSLYVNAHYLRAEVNYELGRNYSAVSDINNIFELEITPSAYTGKYYLTRGKSFLALDELVKAKNDLQISYALSPNNDELYYYKAKLGLAEKTYESALEDLELAISIRSDNPAYYGLRSEIKIKHLNPVHGSDVYYSILEDLDVAISLTSENYTYYLVRSKFLADMGEVDESIADYDQLVALFPNNEDPYIERGVIKMNDYKYKSASQDFTKSIAINPNSEQSYRYRGLCKHNMNNISGAYKDFSKSIELLTKNYLSSNLSTEKKEKVQRLLAECYVLRGHCLNSMEKNSLACEDFLRAYHLGIKKGLNYYRKYCGKY